MAKSANGMGTLRKRSDGRWEARYTAPDGRQKSVYGKTKAECADKLRRALAQITTGTYFEPSAMTLGQWIELWLTEYTDHIKGTTRDSYRSYCKTHILPQLGGVKLSKLSALHIQTAYNALQRRGLAASTLHSSLLVLSAALSAACRFGMIPVNPCQGVTLRKKEQREMVIIDRQDIPAFLAAAATVRHGDAFVFLFQTGIRAGELRGLRWADIDFKAHTMTISRQISLVGKEHVIDTPKSGKPRTIALMPETVELLKRHRAEQLEAQVRAKRWSEAPIDADLVFRKPDGTHYSTSLLDSAIPKLALAMNLPGLRVHDLRHSYAVAALRSGIDAKTVQNNLGHASAKMTLDIYAKYTDDMGRQAAKKMSAYWRRNAN